MRLSRRELLAGTAAGMASYRAAHASSEEPVRLEALHPTLRGLVTKPHPLETLAREAEPFLQVCAVDRGAWTRTLAGTDSADPDPRVREALDLAARYRLEQFFGRTANSPTVKAFIRAGASASEGVDRIIGPDGHPYAFAVLGHARWTTPRALFAGVGLDPRGVHPDALRHGAALVRIGVGLTALNQLRHLLDRAHVSSEAKGRLPVPQRFHGRHVENVRASAFENAGLMRAGASPALIRLSCDLGLLWSFYGATNGVERPQSSRMGALATTFLSRGLYSALEERRAALIAAPPDLRQLVQLSDAVARRASLPAAEFAAISASLVEARRAFLERPLAWEPFTDSAEGPMRSFRRHADEPLPRKPLVAEAVARGTLDPRAGYVQELLQAERRVLIP